jgi:lysophospholipid acyltransferase (LPLAT)-like uncharacterized protein
VSLWLKYRLLAWLASVVWKALKATLRRRGGAGIDAVRALVEADRRIVFAFWHRRLVMMPLGYPFARRDGKGVAILSSDSRDGEMSAAIWRHLGIHAVRGSASHGGGAQGLAKMIQAVRDGWDLGITPDGPRGPRFEAKPGAIAVARKTGAWVVPITVAYSGAWLLGTWDGMLVPKPFSSVAVLYGEPYLVPEKIGDEAPYARALQDAMMALEKAADEFFI